MSASVGTIVSSNESLNDFENIILEGVIEENENAMADCFIAAKLVDDMIEQNKTSLFVFGELDRRLKLYSIKDSITIFPRDTPSSLEIQFNQDKIISNFKGKDLSVSLPFALNLIHNLGEIFEKERSFEKQFSDLLKSIKEVNKKENATGEISLGEKISYCPVRKRLVLFTIGGGQSSITLESIKKCKHLFNDQFANEICSFFNKDANTISLHTAINRLYLGRCIIGIWKSMKEKFYSNESHKNEFARIISLIQKNVTSIYKKPLR